MQENNKKQFSNFAKPHQPLEGSKYSINDVLNREILILDYKIKDSKYHKELPCLTLQFSMNDSEEKHIIFTSSIVLIEQIQTYKEELPYPRKEANNKNIGRRLSKTNNMRN